MLDFSTLNTDGFGAWPFVLCFTSTLELLRPKVTGTYSEELAAQQSSLILYNIAILKQPYDFLMN